MTERAVDLLPSVQLIGAQKAGTSAIADWLFDGGFHRPQVFGDEPSFYGKEVHYFDIDWRFNQGTEFYARRFQNVPDGLAVDATPDTLQYAERVHHVYESAGGNQVNIVKIMVVLRDPIYRELSLYNHLVFDCRNLDVSELNDWHKQVMKSDGAVMSFDEFVRNVSVPALSNSDQEAFVGRGSGQGRSSRHGLYALHLQKWFDLFDRKQILVLSYDELCNDPLRLQGRIQRFLGCNVPGVMRRTNSNDSRHKVQEPSMEARQRLSPLLKPHNERLYQLLETRPGPPMEQTPFPRFPN